MRAIGVAILLAPMCLAETIRLLPISTIDFSGAGGVDQAATMQPASLLTAQNTHLYWLRFRKNNVDRSPVLVRSDFDGKNLEVRALTETGIYEAAVARDGSQWLLSRRPGTAGAVSNFYLVVYTKLGARQEYFLEKPLRGVFPSGDEIVTLSSDGVVTLTRLADFGPAVSSATVSANLGNEGQSLTLLLSGNRIALVDYRNVVIRVLDPVAQTVRSAQVQSAEFQRARQAYEKGLAALIENHGDAAKAGNPRFIAAGAVLNDSVFLMEGFAFRDEGQVVLVVDTNGIILRRYECDLKVAGGATLQPMFMAVSESRLFLMDARGRGLIYQHP